jgi:hypothetical protein
MFMKRTLHGMSLDRRVLSARARPSAQVDRATLSGVVRDTGGGVVPGATVTVTNSRPTSSRTRTTRDRLVQVVNLIPAAIRSTSS